MPSPSQRLLDEGFFEFKKRAGDGLCWVRHCSNPSRHDRCLCHKHEMRRWRGKRQGAAAFHTLKHHARERRIAFTITRDYFMGLTDAYCMHDQNGGRERGDVLTIDRVDAARGYEPGNLRVVSLSENCWKSNVERHLPEHVRAMLERQRAEVREECAAWLEEDDDDKCPF